MYQHDTVVYRATIEVGNVWCKVHYKDLHAPYFAGNQMTILAKNKPGEMVAILFVLVWKS